MGGPDATRPRAGLAPATGATGSQGVCFVSRSIAAPGQRKGLPMFGSLARLALAFTTLMLVIPDTFAHDSWISRGGHRNAAGEWCCGEGDCFVVPKERVMLTGEGYVIIHGPLAGIGPSMYEAVPFTEAQPSPDGEFWRCKRPDGSRRCFFAPPPAT